MLFPPPAVSGDARSAQRAGCRWRILIFIQRQHAPPLYTSLCSLDCDDYLFHAKSGRPLSTTNIEKSWARILKGAKVDHKKFHTLHHTNASMLLAAGVPLLEVAHRLGHSKAAHTLNLYGHAVPGMGKEIAEIAGKYSLLCHRRANNLLIICAK